MKQLHKKSDAVWKTADRESFGSFQKAMGAFIFLFIPSFLQWQIIRRSMSAGWKEKFFNHCAAMLLIVCSIQGCCRRIHWHCSFTIHAFRTLPDWHYCLQKRLQKLFYHFNLAGSPPVLCLTAAEESVSALPGEISWIPIFLSFSVRPVNGWGIKGTDNVSRVVLAASCKLAKS